jgi:S1-C subfamily serine protease
MPSLAKSTLRLALITIVLAARALPAQQGGEHRSTAGQACPGMSILVQDDDLPYITIVKDSTPASAAGFREGDVVVAVNGAPKAPGPIMLGKEPGDAITVTVKRGSESKVLNLVFGRTVPRNGILRCEPVPPKPPKG